MDKETRGQGDEVNFSVTQFLNDGAETKINGIWLSIQSYWPPLFQTEP